MGGGALPSEKANKPALSCDGRPGREARSWSSSRRYSGPPSDRPNMTCAGISAQEAGTCEVGRYVAGAFGGSSLCAVV